jgi:hypothetical protein
LPGAAELTHAQRSKTAKKHRILSNFMKFQPRGYPLNEQSSFGGRV